MILSNIKDFLSRVKGKVRPVAQKLRFLWFPILLCYLEFVIHYFAYGEFGTGIVWIILFSFGIGSFITFLTSVFPRKINSFLTYFFTFAFTILFEVQTVYFEIFKGFAPVSAVKLGAQAVTNFKGNMYEGIKSAMLWVIAILFPFLVLCIFSIWLKPKFSPSKRIIKRFIPLAISVVCLVGTVGLMATFFNGTPSVYMIFSSSQTTTDRSVDYFGINATAIQEFRWILFPENGRITEESLSNRDFEEGDQVDSLVDFDALYKKAGDNDALKNLTAELSNMPVSQKNMYTGLCEDYNLVVVCAEAFSPVCVDPITTPTLHKLINNGFVFENFYATFPNTTTNGEYAFLMGLYPDMSRTKTDSSFGLSTTNYLPYCYGNLFKKDGANAYAFHNYVGEFYYRNQTHPNMGYEFKSANSGLDIEMTSPTSDFEMFSETIGDLAYSGERFVAYYMTYSGHYPYGPSNAMCEKNINSFSSGLSDTAKAYIACNLELESGLSYLMETLEVAGIADKTMIVLTTDHYPYGLTDEEYRELAAHVGVEINDVFDKQKNSFVCYIPNMDPIHIDEYCSTVDILPTVLNLLGYTYDSRLLVGQDVLDPNAEHVAVLADGSFITDGVRYDASTIQYSYDNKNDESVALGEKLYKAVEKRFRVSTEILNNDYYSFVYDEESHSAPVDNLTSQYTDVEIMEQSSVYYVLKNNILDPDSETKFGIYSDCTIVTVIDSLYRIAGKPEVDAAKVNAPYAVEAKYKDAVAWAFDNGILKNDGLILDDLNQQIQLGQFALLLERIANYLGIDTTVDEKVVKNVAAVYTNIDDEIIRASVYCRDYNIIRGDGNEDYIFYTSTAGLSKGFITDGLYKICSYYIMPEK